MTWEPLLGASAAIQWHAAAAAAAFSLGMVQLVAPKGTIPHRAIGWAWVVLMLAVTLSSFPIQELRVWGGWSPIHILSLFTLVMLGVGIWHARRHAVQHHRWTMIGLFFGALLIAGLFTFVPGRIMHATLLGR